MRTVFSTGHIGNDEFLGGNYEGMHRVYSDFFELIERMTEVMSGQRGD